MSFFRINFTLLLWLMATSGNAAGISYPTSVLKANVYKQRQFLPGEATYVVVAEVMTGLNQCIAKASQLSAQLMQNDDDTATLTYFITQPLELICGERDFDPVFVWQETLVKVPAESHVRIKNYGPKRTTKPIDELLVSHHLPKFGRPLSVLTARKVSGSIELENYDFEVEVTLLGEKQFPKVIKVQFSDPLVFGKETHYYEITHESIATACQETTYIGQYKPSGSEYIDDTSRRASTIEIVDQRASQCGSNGWRIKIQHAFPELSPSAVWFEADSDIAED